MFTCEAYTFGRPVRYLLDYAVLREHLAALDLRQMILTHT